MSFTANDTYFALLINDINLPEFNVYTNNMTLTNNNSISIAPQTTSNNVNVITFQMQTLNNTNFLCIAITYINAGQNLYQASIYGFVNGSPNGPISNAYVNPADLPISFPSLVMMNDTSFFFQYIKSNGNIVNLSQNVSTGVVSNLYTIPNVYTQANVIAKYDNNNIIMSINPVGLNFEYYKYNIITTTLTPLSGFPILPPTKYYSSPFISTIQIGTITNTIPSIYYPIWTIQDYVNKINTALLSAFNVVFPPGNPQQPSIPYLSYSNAKFSMNVPASFTADSDYSISFNTRLGRRFLFNTKPGVVLTGVNPITTLTENFYPLQLLEENPNEENPITQIYNYPQPNSTAYKFFDITRVIIGSTKLSVAGDTELSNTSLLNITDFAVDTTSPNVLLQIYEPAILRYYQMYQTAPLTMLDCFLQYATKDGVIYPINLIPGESASMKLLFRRSNLQITKF